MGEGPGPEAGGQAGNRLISVRAGPFVAGLPRSRERPGLLARSPRLSSPRPRSALLGNRAAVTPPPGKGGTVAERTRGEPLSLGVAPEGSLGTRWPGVLRGWRGGGGSARWLAVRLASEGGRREGRVRGAGGVTGRPRDPDCCASSRPAQIPREPGPRPRVPASPRPVPPARASGRRRSCGRRRPRGHCRERSPQRPGRRPQRMQTPRGRAEWGGRAPKVCRVPGAAWGEGWG